MIRLKSSSEIREFGLFSTSFPFSVRKVTNDATPMLSSLAKLKSLMDIYYSLLYSTMWITAPNIICRADSWCVCRSISESSLHLLFGGCIVYRSRLLLLLDLFEKSRLDLLSRRSRLLEYLNIFLR